MAAITTTIAVTAAAAGGGAPLGWDYPAIKPYAAIVQRVAAEEQIDPKLIAAMIVIESAGAKGARTLAGKAKDGTKLWAVGLMQVIAKAKVQDFEDRPTELKLLNPETNIRWGCKVLKWSAFHHTPEYRHGIIATALYGYSGGSRWPSDEAFRRGYLYHVEDRYHSLFGATLDVSAPLIVKPQPPSPAKDQKAYHDPLQDILVEMQEIAERMTVTAGKLEHYLDAQKGGDR